MTELTASADGPSETAAAETVVSKIKALNTIQYALSSRLTARDIGIAWAQFTCLGIACRVRPNLLNDNLHIHSAEYREQGSQAIATLYLTASYGLKVEEPKLPLLERAVADIVASDAHGFTADWEQKGKSHTIVDVSGRDRPGLLHDVSRALSFVGVSVDGAKIFSHKGRMLDIFFVTESQTHKRIEDPRKLQRVKEVIAAAMKDPEAKINISSSLRECLLNRDAELQQLTSDQRPAAEAAPAAPAAAAAGAPAAANGTGDHYFVFREQENDKVQVEFNNDDNPDATSVAIKCPDYMSLLFDVCNLMSDLGVRVRKARSWKDEASVRLEILITDEAGGKLQEAHAVERLRRLIIATVLNPATESDEHSVVEFYAPDRPNLLRDVTEALRRLGVQVTQARVATYGSRVKDIFCIQDANGHKITNETLMAHIYSTIVQAMMG